MDYVKETFYELDNAVDYFKGNGGCFVAYTCLKRHLRPNTNLITKEDGGKYGATSLAEEMGISRQMATTYLKTLREKQIVKDRKTDNGKYLVMNPEFCYYGEIDEETKELFKEN